MLGAQILGGLLKSKVKVPEFINVDALAEQSKAILGNQTALPAAKALASDANQFNQEEILKQLRAVIPNFDELLGTSSSNIASQLRGEIPEDVVGQIYRGNVAKGLTSGTGASSPRTSSLTARDLGLTSLAIKDKGFDSLTRWIGTAKQNMSAPIFDVTSMFITPQQQIGLAVSERDKKFQRDFGSNQLRAAQSTGTIVGNAIIDTDNQMMQMASSLGGAALGAMCWVAREVYGSDNPAWMQFRAWMLTKASPRRLARYLAHGPEIAEWLKSRPGYKAILRRWMDLKILEVQNG